MMSQSSPSPSVTFFPSSTSSTADSPSFPSLPFRSPSPQVDTTPLSLSSSYSTSSSSAVTSDSLSLHTTSSAIQQPFPPVRQRSTHIPDSITILSSPTSAYNHSSSSSSPLSSSAHSTSLLTRCKPPLFRLRLALLVLVSIVALLLLVSAAVTSVGLSSLPLVALVSPTSSTRPAAPHSGDRSILHTPSSPLTLSHGSCVNSVQGKELLVDSRGAVCDRQDVDADSGCCTRQLERLSCRSCRHDLRCCHSYEYCISCCIGRQSAVTQHDSQLQVFGQCAAVCRTSSASIKHGNVYKHTYHHCYDKTGPVALNASAFPPPLPATATDSPQRSALSIVAAELGYSCDATCANRSLACHDSLLSHVNTCTALSQHFPCSDCEASDGGDQPAWVSDRAGSGYPEGRCLVQRAGVAGGLTCEGRHEKTRRLCVCLREEAEGEGMAVEVGHFDGDDDT